MSGAIDLVSPERLQRIRELAKKATPGPWFRNGAVTICPPHGYEQEFEEVANEGDGIYEHNISYCHEEADVAYIAATHPGVVLAMCAEIERLRESVALLNEEAEWLAEHMPKTSMIDGKAKVQCLRGMQEWRETARKAAEEICKK